MLKVISKIKEGNKVSYICIDSSNNTSHNYTLDKGELIEYIRKGQVLNARIQDYKGQLIIRVKEDTDTKIKKQKTTTKSKSKYAIELYKEIIAEFSIKHEELALEVGFNNYDLEEDITNSTQEYIADLSYQMASDIKRIADSENNMLLKSYRNEYMAYKE